MFRNQSILLIHNEIVMFTNSFYDLVNINVQALYHVQSILKEQVRIMNHMSWISLMGYCKIHERNLFWYWFFMISHISNFWEIETMHVKSKLYWKIVEWLFSNVYSSVTNQKKSKDWCTSFGLSISVGLLFLLKVKTKPQHQKIPTY